MYKVKPVNLEIAGTIKDYELTNRVFTNIVLSLDKNIKDVKAQLSQKTTQEQTVYFASVLDMQVLNGGISQYLGNYGNIYDSEIIAALRNLELPELLLQFEQIRKLTGKEHSELKSHFDAYDRFYYKMNQDKSMDSHLKKYIIQNIKVFETH
jgi:hypothetical protein